MQNKTCKKKRQAPGRRWGGGGEDSRDRREGGDTPLTAVGTAPPMLAEHRRWVKLETKNEGNKNKQKKNKTNRKPRALYSQMLQATSMLSGWRDNTLILDPCQIHFVGQREA